MTRTMSVNDHSLLVTPAAIAGVIRRLPHEVEVVVVVVVVVHEVEPSLKSRWSAA
jgi:hypothetical protein